MIIVPEYDMHVHTVLCGHAHESATVERLAAHATALNMRLLCFSEHVHDESSLHELNQVRKMVADVQRFNRCRLAVGAEIDVDPFASDGRLAVEPPEWVEFVIGSIHFLPGTRILPHRDRIPPEFSYERIFNEWSRNFIGLTENRKVDMIGHPGAFIFNAVGSEYRERIMTVFRDGARTSAAAGQAWDFNNLTFAKLRGEARRNYWQVMQLAHDEGVPLLYGSDTHNVTDIGKITAICEALEKMHGFSGEELFRIPEWLAGRFRLDEFFSAYDAGGDIPPAAKG